MKLYIIILCTNKYYSLGVRLGNAITKYYNGVIPIVINFFADKNPIDDITESNINVNYNYYNTIHKNWYEGANSKFKHILQVINDNEDENDNYITLMDADTNINKFFNEQIFIHDLFGAEHFDNNTIMINNKPYDRNEQSKAYIPYNTSLNQVYFQGALFGGSFSKIKEMCTILIEWQEYNKNILNYEPIWNDESYLNKYYHYNPPNYIILWKDYPFVVSDKDTIGDQRDFVLIENFKSISNSSININNFLIIGLLILEIIILCIFYNSRKL